MKSNLRIKTLGLVLALMAGNASAAIVLNELTTYYYDQSFASEVSLTVSFDNTTYQSGYHEFEKTKIMQFCVLAFPGCSTGYSTTSLAFSVSNDEVTIENLYISSGTPSGLLEADLSYLTNDGSLIGPYVRHDLSVATVVPIPSGVWLFSSALVGLLGAKRNRLAAN